MKWKLFQQDTKNPMAALVPLCSYTQCRRRIIEPAIAELKKKDDWLIDWKPIKRGRKVAQLEFRFARNPQMSLL